MIACYSHWISSVNGSSKADETQDSDTTAPEHKDGTSSSTYVTLDACRAFGYGAQLDGNIGLRQLQ